MRTILATRRKAHNKRVVPSGGLGHLFKVEGLRRSMRRTHAFYNAVRPTVEPVAGPVWSLRFQPSLLFLAK